MWDSAPTGPTKTFFCLLKNTLSQSSRIAAVPLVLSLLALLYFKLQRSLNLFSCQVVDCNNFCVEGIG